MSSIPSERDAGRTTPDLVTGAAVEALPETAVAV
jgi:hypothetical protein